MTEVVWLKVAVVIGVALVIQVAVLDQIVLWGTHPDVMVLLPVVAAVLAGAERGATIAFIAGLAADLIVPLPFGLSPLTYVLVGFALGSFVASPMGRDLAGARTTVAVVGSVAVTVGYIVLGALLGQPGMLTDKSAIAIIIIALGAVVLSRPMFGAFGWALTGSRTSSSGYGPTGGRSAFG